MTAFKYTILDEKGQSGEWIRFYKGESKTIYLYMYNQTYVPLTTPGGQTEQVLKIPKAGGGYVEKKLSDSSLHLMQYSVLNCYFTLTPEETELFDYDSILAAELMVEISSGGNVSYREYFEIQKLFQIKVSSMNP